MFKIIKRRTTHINGYYKNINHDKNNHFKQIIFLVLFMTGLIIGSVTVKNGTNELLTKLLSVYENYIDVKSSDTLLVNFCNSMLKYTIILILTYSAGLCAVGIPIIYGIPLVNGIGLGTISAHMYSTFALKGIGYCALLIYPSKILTTIIMIAACSYSSLMSTKILKLLTNCEEEISYRNYNIKYIILFSLSVFSAFADALLNNLLSGYFSFH